MRIQDLKPPKGAKSSRKRRGRGMGSGIGKTSGKGHKGQKARSGSKKPSGFEGGQMPLVRRIPKVGFASKNRIEFDIINLEKLNNFKDDSSVTPQLLRDRGVVNKKIVRLKILGRGELKKKLKVSAHAFSASAKNAIEKAGGCVTVIASEAPKKYKAK